MYGCTWVPGPGPVIGRVRLKEAAVGVFVFVFILIFAIINVLCLPSRSPAPDEGRSRSEEIRGRLWDVGGVGRPCLNEVNGRALGFFVEEVEEDEAGVVWIHLSGSGRYAAFGMTRVGCGSVGVGRINVRMMGRRGISGVSPQLSEAC